MIEAGHSEFIPNQRGQFSNSTRLDKLDRLDKKQPSELSRLDQHL